MQSRFILIPLLFAVLFILNSFVAYANEKNPVGNRKSAEKFFTPDIKRTIASQGNQFLALHIGTFVNSTAYVWGTEAKTTDIAKNTLGFTYLVGEWSGSMDVAIRVDYNTYEIEGEKPTKLSFMPLLLFPQMGTRFPIYFGMGAGAGVFFKQIREESNLTLEYQLFMGIRVLNIMDNAGFFIEGGMKNFVNVLSDGQFNGSYIASGMVFSF